MFKKMATLLLLAIMVGTFALPSTQVEAASKKYYVASTVNDLNIRSSAKMGPNVVGKLNKGQKLQRTGSYGYWTRVSYNGKNAWVATRYVRAATNVSSQTLAKTASNKIYVVSSVNGLNIRSSAKMGSNVVGKLNKGQKLQRTGSYGYWTRVNYKGKNAWISTKYLRTTSPVTKTNVSKQTNNKVYTMRASAYTPYCKGCSGKTALGWNVRTQKRNVIAVDPRVIPLGSKVQVYVGGKLLGTYTAADTGGAIKGNKIDILMYSYKEAIRFGRQTVTVKVI